MRVASFPLATRLTGLGESSSRQFQLRMLDQQREEVKRNIEQITNLFEAELDAQKQIAELQQISMDGLAEATRLNTEAIETYNEFATQQAQDADSRLAALDEAINDRSGRLTALEKKVDLLLKWLKRHSSDSAGGKIGTPIEDDVTALGVFNATGDIRQWRTTHVLLPGGAHSKAWIRCEGQILSISEFRPLFDVIGHDYDTALIWGSFRIPSKSDLTSDPKILNDSKWVYLIRT